MQAGSRLVQCLSPIGAYRKSGGGIAFTPSGGDFDKHVEIPCGKCIGCRLEKSRQWAVRMMHEAQMHEKNCFLTLTYDPEHYPLDGSVNVKHWQAFAKRLRKIKGPFRFYHCGEYGDEKHRAHYHAAVFGLDFAESRKPWDKSHGHQMFVSDELNDIWQLGYVVIGNLTFESAAYVAQYITKKLNASPKLSLIGIQKEPYATMSRRPGLGKKWYDEFKHDVYPSDQVIMRGHPMKPPKYYDDLWGEECPDEMKIIQRRRRRDARAHAAENTPERRRVKELCKEQYGRFFSRDFSR